MLKLLYNMNNQGSDLLLKAGIALIALGLLILLLKEIIILVLASIFIAIGIFLITVFFKTR